MCGQEEMRLGFLATVLSGGSQIWSFKTDLFGFIALVFYSSSLSLLLSYYS